MKKLVEKFKKISKNVKNGAYSECVLSELKNKIDMLEIEMSMYEEEMTFSQSDICWEAIDQLKAYTRGKYPEYDEECKIEEKKHKEWEEKMEKEGNIIHLNFSL